MTQYTRKNAWDANNGGQFTNPDGSYTDLYWYAIAVGVMKQKPINDPMSWWFYAAIHGQYLTDYFGSGAPPANYPNWTKIKSIPATAQLDVPPGPGLINLFWNQCQHGTWYFAPWHRGYLIALENIMRDIIIRKGGPSDWALPYWNYLNQSTTYPENYIPPAFTQTTLPDGVTPNPLFVPERYGPEGNPNKVYLVVGNSISININDECQWDTVYSSSSDPLVNPATPPDQPGTTIYGDHWGGAETGFSHSNGGYGDLEMNPHNFAHSIVGGMNSEAWSISGFMFNVQSRLPWQSTGINVVAGSSVTVQYSSGTWTADPSDMGGTQYDANGSPDIVVPASQPLYPMVNKPMGCLVGRVNGGAPFYIGDNTGTTPVTVPVGQTGLLELCINDDLTGAYGAGLTDNQGQIVVNISVAFTLQSTKPWQNTGISVSPGATVVVSASGSWSADPSDKDQPYGPNGSPDIIVPASQPLYPITGIPMGALIGRVNGGAPFVIGAGSVIPDSVAGELELCINDDLTGAYGAGLSDNSGTLTITFTTTPKEEYEGLMADPGLAGLDPVFFMHHANIDRMWAAWIITGQNSNPNAATWLSGPAANGNNEFAMPMDSSGTPWVYTPQEMQDISNLNYYNGAVYAYTYDDLSLTSYSNTKPPTQLYTQRLALLGAKQNIKNVKLPSNLNSELVGSSSNGITLKSGTTSVPVKLDNSGWKTVANSLVKASEGAVPDQVFLILENVTGTNNSNFLTVYVNNKLVKTVSLFGIRMASMKDGAHGGSGLTFKFDITSIVDAMHLGNTIDVTALNVQIVTKNPIALESVLKIGRIGLYRTGQ